MPRKTNTEDTMPKTEETAVEEATEADETADTSKMTEEQKIAHRERVRLSAAARTAALKRLVDIHKVEYDKIHEEEKEKLGIRSRTAARIEKERAKFLEMLAANPDFAALVGAQSPNGKA